MWDGRGQRYGIYWLVGIPAHPLSTLTASQTSAPRATWHWHTTILPLSLQFYHSSRSLREHNYSVIMVVITLRQHLYRWPTRYDLCVLLQQALVNTDTHAQCRLWNIWAFSFVIIIIKSGAAEYYQYIVDSKYWFIWPAVQSQRKTKDHLGILVFHNSY